jgi:hypothetical protein
MQSTVAHGLQLIAHGNVLLASRRATATPNHVERPVFVESCRFNRLYDRNGQTERDTIAHNPSEWFQHLKSTSCKALAMYVVPVNVPIQDWKTAGLVGGGGRWLLAATYHSHRDYWQSSWIVTDPHRPDKRIWQVEYDRVIRSDRGLPPVTLSLSECKAALSHALSDIVTFARDVGLTQYERTFQNALDTLIGRVVTEPEVFRGTSIGKHANALASAAEQAWVFGAMGSWCDQGFEEPMQARFEHLSERLYSCISHSLVCAANATGKRSWWRPWHE